MAEKKIEPCKNIIEDYPILPHAKRQQHRTEELWQSPTMTSIKVIGPLKIDCNIFFLQVCFKE